MSTNGSNSNLTAAMAKVVICFECRKRMTLDELLTGSHSHPRLDEFGAGSLLDPPLSETGRFVLDGSWEYGGEV